VKLTQNELFLKKNFAVTTFKNSKFSITTFPNKKNLSQLHSILFLSVPAYSRGVANYGLWAGSKPCNYCENLPILLLLIYTIFFNFSNNIVVYFPMNVTTYFRYYQEDTKLN
jgi:hypothetical protein